MPTTDYIIGTRGSLLAVTQSTLIKNELEKKTGKTFEIKTIKTQGDIQTDKPLWQLDGKDFFTKELDQALLNKEIDLVIHSYKDLGSERPEGIQLAAITKRTFAHDILLIRNETIEKIPQIKEFVVGTSSPRRIQNIDSSLKEFLPDSEEISVRCETLRGNVNTRIQKLRDGKYHAIILAMAGLERLCKLDDSKTQLKSLLKDLNFMILPQSEFASAASQGALAIECHEENQEMYNLLNKSVNDEVTAKNIAIEREEFQRFGGGCHLAVGIHCLNVFDKQIVYQKGKIDQNVINKKYFTDFSIKEKLKDNLKEKAFIGLPAHKIEKKKDSLVYDELITKTEIDYQIEDANYFITSTYSAQNYSKHKGLSFTSGNRTWKKMAAKGFWINGSSDSLGHKQIENFKNSLLLELLSEKRDWKVLSHSESKSCVGEVIPSYKREKSSPSEAFLEQLLKCKTFFWTSFFQYQTYKPYIKDLDNIVHCCGPGKTLEEFLKNKIEIMPVIDMKQWQLLFK